MDSQNIITPLDSNLQFNLSGLQSKAYQLYAENKAEEALETCKKWLALQPSDAEANHLMAVLLANAQHYLDAHEFVRRALLMKNSPQYFNTLGVCLQNLGDTISAQQSFKSAIGLAPDMPESTRNLAELYFNLGEFSLIIDTLTDSHLLEQDFRIQMLLAKACYYSGEFEEAERYNNILLESQPDLGEALTLQIMLLASTGHEEAAWEQCKNLLKMGVNGFNSFYTQAKLAYEVTGERERAFNLINQALMLRQDHEARLTLGLAQLCLGHFKDGWQNYDIQHQTPKARNNERKFLHHAWDGTPKNGSNRLMIHCGPDLCSAIPLLRFIPDATNLITRIALMCHETDVPLLSSLEGPRIVEHYDVYGKYPTQFHVPIERLPVVLKSETLPSAPYLKAHAGKLPENLKPRKKGGPMRVGIAWSPDHLNSDTRSSAIPFAELKPLIGVLNIEIYSLQTGIGAAEMNDEQVIDLKEHVDNNSANLARTIEALDLVICADTLTAHIAGAIGSEAWVILPKAAHWVWGNEGDSTEWYPSLRLFRQDTAGKWATVIQQVCAQFRDTMA